MGKNLYNKILQFSLMLVLLNHWIELIVEPLEKLGG